MSIQVFNQFNESWFYLIDVTYVLEKLEKEWQYEETKHVISQHLLRLNNAMKIIVDLQKEEEEKLRMKRKDLVKVDLLKEALHDVTQVKCLLQHIDNTVESHSVHWGLQQVTKGEEMLTTTYQEEMNRIQEEKEVVERTEPVSEERRRAEFEKRRAAEFIQLNKNWIIIQEKFRAMGHPDWLPEEEQKKKKGFLRRVSQKQTAAKIMELNQNWDSIQDRFRALGHPEWLPEEEQKKKKKKGFLRRVRGWLQKWTR